MNRDLEFLALALGQAKEAALLGEVPVGAVLVRDDRVVAMSSNRRESRRDPLGHAEIQVISEAARELGDWRLRGTTLYTTLEPCPMCAGAILHARVSRVVFGAWDVKWGAAGSVVNVLKPGLFNHAVELVYMEMRECGDILRTFFRERRGKDDKVQ